MIVEKRYYICPICGKIVEEVHPNNAAIKCCGEPMKLLQEKTADAAGEKHVPYIERVEGGVLVKVGKETEHPMSVEHQIVFIEILADGVYMRKYLRSDDKPEAFFKTDAKDITAWEMCNKHGLWRSS